jgi:stage III sporulation protein AA
MLILGPPGRGKTTLLRDLLVHLSDRGLQRIGLVDERGEIAACVEGTPQLYVGSRTDVLTNIRKDSGIMILMRSMNPQWIAVDEITAEHDIHAMEQASYCGVKLIATAHGESLADLKKRPLYKKLLNTGVFGQAAVIYPDRTYRIEEIEI